mgnify:CR=1 FL=1
MKETGRTLKKKLFDLLNQGDLERAIAAADHLVPRRIINPLLSFIQSADEKLKWGAVKLIGHVVTQLAERDLESARVIMRRLMWNLNDESGAMGWGSPEAMGEILASHGGLAREYAPILLSYARKDGNYLEHEGLQRGLLWGIGRLCEKKPELVREASVFLLPYLQSQDAMIRGLAVRIMGLLKVQHAAPRLRGFTEDEAELTFLLGNTLTTLRVKDLAQEALRAIQ